MTMYSAEEHAIDELDRELGTGRYGRIKEELYQLKLKFESLTDIELYKKAMDRGEGLNKQGFPAFDVAKKLHDNNWTATKKQRAALINALLEYESDCRIIVY